MKTLFFSCLISLFSVIGCSAQNHSFDKFFDRYADKDGFLTLKFSNLPHDMLNDGQTDPDFRISSLRILTVQDDKLNTRLNFFNEIVPQINRAGYEELMTIKKKGEKAILLCKKDKKRITEVLFVSGGDKNVMVEITGSMSLTQA
ncbi:MAG TPA: DUF4252 domain-containing protein, partial [Bacteroidales bacterium]